MGDVLHSWPAATIHNPVLFIILSQQQAKKGSQCR